MKNLSKMTDQDLVAKAQSYKTECSSRGIYIGELYRRYVPLINKHAGMLFKSQPKDRTYYEDFLQDAYFAVVKAIDLVKWEKVNTGWKFVRVLWPQLHKLRTAYQKKFQDLNKEVSTVVAMQPVELSGDEFSPHIPEHINAYKHLEVDFEYYRPYTDRFQDEREQFFNTLTHEEQVLLRYRQRGYTLDAAAKKMGRSYSYAQRTLVQCKARAAQIFDVQYV
jgi:hypothetical protein